jgi:hypothetical protein
MRSVRSGAGDALRAIVRDGRSYLVFAALQLIAATVFAGALSATFGYPAAGVGLHVAYALAWVSVQTAVLGAATHAAMRVSPAAARLLVTVALGSVVAALLAIYATNAISNLAWHTNVDRTLLRRAPAHLDGVAAALRVPALALHLALAAGVVACWAAVYPFAPRIARALCRLCSGASSGGLLSTRARAACALVWTLGFPTYLLFQSVVLFAPGAGHAWRGEVISSLLLDEGERTFRDKPHLLRVSLGDVPVRRGYARMQLGEAFPNLVVINVDALRPASTQVYGYARPTTPFLLELQERKLLTRVEFATATCPDSLCGILSTLSSRHFNDITYELFKLNDLLYQIGYRVSFILSGDHSWRDIRGLVGRSVHEFSDGYGSSLRTINDDRALLEKLAAQPRWDGRPTFFFLHLMSAHPIGAKLEYDELWHDERRRAHWTALRADAAQHAAPLQRYDERVLQADGVIEQIFTLLDEKGYLGRSVVIITADHGEALGEHGQWGHGGALFQQSLRIPLLIFDSAGGRYANTAFATQVDIAPTLVDRLSLPIPATWQGRSLLAPPATRYTYHQTHVEPYRYAVIRAEQGEIHALQSGPDPDDAQRSVEQLFDLVRDPGETTDLSRSAPPGLVEDLRDHLAQYRAAEQ